MSIPRNDPIITEVDIYKLIVETETHHDHEIVEVNGVLRWKAQSTVELLTDICNLNDIVIALYSRGLDKNSEEHRKLYRDMGYSLRGYWEIFYWEMNNKDADQYNPTCAEGEG